MTPYFSIRFVSNSSLSRKLKGKKTRPMRRIETLFYFKRKAYFTLVNIQDQGKQYVSKGNSTCQLRCPFGNPYNKNHSKYLPPVELLISPMSIVTWKILLSFKTIAIDPRTSNSTLSCIGNIDPILRWCIHISSKGKPNSNQQVQN